MWTQKCVSSQNSPLPNVWISSTCMHLTSFDLTWFVENVSRPLFFNASAVYTFIMQRLMPNNYGTSYKHTYPSLKSPFLVLILLSVCNAIQGLHTEDSTWMHLLKVQGRYVDVSVLLQNGFMANLWITTQSFDGLVDTHIQGHFCFTNYSLFYCHVNHHCLSQNLVTLTSMECHCRHTDHIPTNSSKKHVFCFSTLTHYTSQSFTGLSSTCSLSGITFINQMAVCLNVIQCRSIMLHCYTASSTDGIKT